MERIYAFVLMVTISSPAIAGQCDSPPYGDTQARYTAFVETYSRLLDNPSRVLASICRQKFDGVDRTALYRLGFTDEAINSKATSVLAIEVMNAIRKAQ